MTCPNLNIQHTFLLTCPMGNYVQEMLVAGKMQRDVSNAYVFMCFNSNLITCNALMNFYKVEH